MSWASCADARLAPGSSRVLGAVVFAALILAVLVQERHPKADDLTKEARQAERDLLLNANHAFAEISPKEIPFS